MLLHNLTVHLLSLTVDQTTDIILYSADKYTKTVFTQEIAYVLKNAAQKASHQSNNDAFAHWFVLYRVSERRWSPTAPSRRRWASRPVWLTTRRNEGWPWTGGWRTRTQTWPPPPCQCTVKKNCLLLVSTYLQQMQFSVCVNCSTLDQIKPTNPLKPSNSTFAGWSRTLKKRCWAFWLHTRLKLTSWWLELGESVCPNRYWHE